MKESKKALTFIASAETIVPLKGNGLEGSYQE